MVSTNGHETGEQSTNEYVIETQDLWRIYRMGGQEVPALRGVDLQIGAGQLVALKGRSGSGKTTLLNCLGGLDHPTRGSVRIFGEEIGGWSEKKLTNWRRRQVGFIFQSFGLLPTLSAYENVELMLRMAGAKGKVRHQKTLECLDLVGLTKWMDHRPYELSGGQQQRVAIARALANDPQLVLADEPTGELDSFTAQEILALFQTIVREQQVTFLMASHDSLVDDYVDRILHLQDGQILENIPAHQLEVNTGIVEARILAADVNDDGVLSVETERLDAGRPETEMNSSVQPHLALDEMDTTGVLEVDDNLDQEWQEFDLDPIDEDLHPVDAKSEPVAPIKAEPAPDEIDAIEDIQIEHDVDRAPAHGARAEDSGDPERKIEANATPVDNDPDRPAEDRDTGDARGEGSEDLAERDSDSPTFIQI